MKKVQQTTKRCAKDFNQMIQLTANTGSILGMYDGINKALKLVKKKTYSLKTSNGVITYIEKQVNKSLLPSERHFSEIVYSLH